MYAGIFLLWFNIIYHIILTGKARKVILRLELALFIYGIINYFLFSNNFGLISSLLVYDNKPQYNTFTILINILILVILVLLIFKFPIKLSIKYASINSILILVISTITIVSSYNIIQIQTITNKSYKLIYEYNDYEPKLTFSKDGNNVLVVFTIYFQ